MGTGLTFEYSNEADVLCILKRPTYIGQETTEIDDFVIARMNPQTREIEYLEILLFFWRLKKSGVLSLPTDATLRLASAGAPEASAQPPSVDATLTIKYDHDGDTLTIDQRRPYPGQAEGEIDEGVTARMNPGTGDIENLAIRSFKARLERDGEVCLPINATLRPVEAPVPAE